MNWELVGFAGAFLTMFGFVPQIRKIYHTESVEDVSLVMLLQFFLGVLLWLLYGLALQDRVLIVSNAVSLSTLAVALGLYFRFHRRRFRDDLE
jgi:MtN3 and saliva related transmembrane protein